MNLYEYRHAVNVVPAESCEDAADRYDTELEIAKDVCKEDFNVLIPHEDYIKAFRLARTLYARTQYNVDDVEVLVDAYVRKLGYSLSPSDLWHGILKWAERLTEMADEDIDLWIN